MKKIIILLLLLITTNLSAVVIVPRHHRVEVPVDNSLHTSLTLKDYHYKCEKCGNEFVIASMLYHENTDMYFYYRCKDGLKFLQPFEGENLCKKCRDKRFSKSLGIALFLSFLVIIIFVWYIKKCD
jgi:DNA-directed RNA polymerase subunit RPC12/RpoP